jgi:alpha-mannosidase
LQQHTARFTPQKIALRLRLIEGLAYRQHHDIPPLRMRELTSPLDAPPLDADTSGWEVIEPQTYWGRKDLNFVMASSFRVPEGWEAPVALYLPLGNSGDFSHPETLAYIDGQPYAAIDRHHPEFLLAEQYRDGKEHRLMLHGWTGLLGGTRVVDEGLKLFMRQPQVVQIDMPTREFIAAARVALDVANYLDDNHPAKGRLYTALDEAFKLLDTREPLGGDKFYSSVSAAYDKLMDGISEAGQPLDVDVIAVGHAHIDTAWLWTLGQTRRKAGRTFHTVMRYMEQYPRYYFTQSQPQLYDYVRRDYPELFEAIKERVAEGRWEPIGGMWVEADCNISGGESLARQFLLGRRFFREHFGENSDSPVLWLPDVFGYAWNLPQLIKLAGLEYFFTIKIGWNQYNKLPYDSFWWQGLDGTKVLTHFSTTPEASNIKSIATYNAEITGMTTLGTWYNLKQKAETKTILMSYGWGDGGGGPDRHMLENAVELANFPGAPRVKQGRVIDFFQQLERESGDILPTWNGELYFELHRGTYTTQSRNKRANRKSEFLLHDAEFVATLASILDPDYAYPYAMFNQAWETVCLNQFHDIIPGSSIGEVYVESLQQYAALTQTITAARDEALRAIVNRVEGDLLVVNPTSFRQHDRIAFWPGQLPADKCLKLSGQSMQPLATQSTDSGTWLLIPEAWPYSVTSLDFVESAAPELENQFTVTPMLLENAVLRVELNEDGDITRIYDKHAMREVMPEGTLANQFQAFEDRPNNWDAWDIDIHYDDRMWTAEPASSVTVLETGPLRATLEIKRRILNSDYTQRLTLSYNSPRLDVETHIDWRERHTLLKAAFPVEILSPRATYEVQFGHVERPTHRNTSWDWARFEVCAQKWVDLSEADYGVTLINDCKYGHDIRDNVIRISLLRSPTNPDPTADAGEHHFSYSLLPHAGGFAVETIAQAYMVNDPLLVADGGAGRMVQSARGVRALVTSNNADDVIETVKRAEDGNGLIVRFYRATRSRGIATLQTGFRLRGAFTTNLLEENQDELVVHNDSVSLNVRPFQIVTLRLIPAIEG